MKMFTTESTKASNVIHVVNTQKHCVVMYMYSNIINMCIVCINFLYAGNLPHMYIVRASLFSALVQQWGYLIKGNGKSKKEKGNLEEICMCVCREGGKEGWRRGERERETEREREESVLQVD